jgi:protein SCO1/2
MDHTPVTLLRIAPDKPWVRIDGFATADDLLHEFGAEGAAR